MGKAKVRVRLLDAGIWLAFVTLFALLCFTAKASAEEADLLAGQDQSSDVVDTKDGPRGTGYHSEPLTLDEALTSTYWQPTAEELADVAATPKYDSRKQGCITGVRDQGQCGSCWAHALLAAAETAIKKATGASLNLSEQELVSCGAAYGCDGGFMTSGKYVTDNGVANDSKYPYTATDSRCKNPLPARNSKVKKGAIAFGFVGRPGQKPPLDWIKAAIKKYGGVYVTVSAGGADWSGSRTHMTSCGNRQTNHMVFLVAWDGLELLIKNSWGTNWGDKGYAWSKQSCNNLAGEGESVGYATYTPGTLND